MSKDIKKQINELQERLDTINFCNYIIKQGNFLKPSKGRPSKIATKVESLVCEFLGNYIKSLEEGYEVDSIVNFSPKDVEVLRLLVDRVGQSSNKDTVKLSVDKPIELQPVELDSLTITSGAEVEKKSSREKVFTVLDGTSAQSSDIQEIPINSRVKVVAIDANDMASVRGIDINFSAIIPYDCLEEVA